MNDDRSTKKAKFRPQREDRDNPEHISFKDILMESQREVEADLISHDDELIF